MSYNSNRQSSVRAPAVSGMSSEWWGRTPPTLRGPLSQALQRQRWTADGRPGVSGNPPVSSQPIHWDRPIEDLNIEIAKGRPQRQAMYAAYRERGPASDIPYGILGETGHYPLHRQPLTFDQQLARCERLVETVEGIYEYLDIHATEGYRPLRIDLLNTQTTQYPYIDGQHRAVGVVDTTQLHNVVYANRCTDFFSRHGCRTVYMVGIEQPIAHLQWCDDLYEYRRFHTQYEQGIGRTHNGLPLVSDLDQQGTHGLYILGPQLLRRIQNWGTNVSNSETIMTNTLDALYELISECTNLETRAANEYPVNPNGQVSQQLLAAQQLKERVDMAGIVLIDMNDRIQQLLQNQGTLYLGDNFIL